VILKKLKIKVSDMEQSNWTKYTEEWKLYIRVKLQIQKYNKSSMWIYIVEELEVIILKEVAMYTFYEKSIVGEVVNMVEAAV